MQALVAACNTQEAVPFVKVLALTENQNSLNLHLTLINTHTVPVMLSSSGNMGVKNGHAALITQ